MTCSSFKGFFNSVVSGFNQMLQKLAADYLASRVTDLIANAFGLGGGGSGKKGGVGGAIGNLIDRIRFGYVVDFMDLSVWPVFNVADSCLVIGVIGFLMAALIVKDRKKKKR